jgi:acyl carrier protein
MPSKEDVEKIIMDAIRATLTAKRLQPPPLSPSTPIDGSLGLDSLDWASVIVRLEETTGVDPFEKPVERQLRTVDDLTSLYHEVLGA